MKFAPYLARGIDIYTGIVWEVFLKDRRIGNQEFNMSIGGGGRYDKIITTFVNDGIEYPIIPIDHINVRLDDSYGEAIF